MAPNRALIRRAVLTHPATTKGLDYEMEMLAPSSTEEGHAYGFASCGADLLLALTHTEEFPSNYRQTTKRGVKGRSGRWRPAGGDLSRPSDGALA